VENPGRDDDRKVSFWQQAPAGGDSQHDAGAGVRPAIAARRGGQPHPPGQAAEAPGHPEPGLLVPCPGAPSPARQPGAGRQPRPSLPRRFPSAIPVASERLVWTYPSWGKTGSPQSTCKRAPALVFLPVTGSTITLLPPREFQPLQVYKSGSSTL